MEPTLAVIGLNFRTSPVAVRERFWISEPRRYEALRQLVRSEGIEEVIVLATCNRTEFILWASDVPDGGQFSAPLPDPGIPAPALRMVALLSPDG